MKPYIKVVFSDAVDDEGIIYQVNDAGQFVMKTKPEHEGTPISPDIAKDAIYQHLWTMALYREPVDS